MADAPAPGVHPVEWRRILPSFPLESVVHSGLRARCGACPPTGARWSVAALLRGAKRYTVCNFPEGESVTFKERASLRANPHAGLGGLAGATSDGIAMYDPNQERKRPDWTYSE